MLPLRWSSVPAALALSAIALSSAAQPRGGPPPPPRSPRDAALADLTGNWVAQITEDWRWRMITPPKGDYASVPLNGLGRQTADKWDIAADVAAGEQCRAFGAGGLMRLPTRLKISWTDDKTLELVTDAGEQTRLFHFGGTPPAAEAPSWQGYSVAEWIGGPPAGGGFGPAVLAGNSEAAAARGGGAPAAPGARGAAPSGARGAAPPGPRGAAPSGATAAAPPGAPPAARPAAPPSGRGSLKVVTTHLRPGYLRKNGVPYSANAMVTEYYDRVTLFGNDYLQVVTVVTDPTYLTGPFTVSNQFKLEPDASKWHPTPCATDAPVGTFQRPQL